MDHSISWEEYLTTFDELLAADPKPAPYDQPIYADFLKLNQKRQNRWLKYGVIDKGLIDTVKSIKDRQTWYIITEPWCGDAAHSIPFIYMIAKCNPKITIRMVWRDTPPFIIDSYLTNGGKSVPKLIIRNDREEDLATWGPRPAPCQSIYLEMKERGADFEEQKITLQNWYNKDKGRTLQAEFKKLLA